MSIFPGAWQRSRTNIPPTEAEILRHDVILFLCVLALLAAGWGVRLLAEQEGTRTADLGPGLPAIDYPATWTPTLNSTAASSESTLLFQARNAASASTFDSTLRVEALPVLPADSLGALRIRQGLRRAQELDRYRELSAEPAALLGGREALLTTYAYLADPTRDSGGNGLPVVVEAQDLLFRHENQWLVITLAADAGDWASAAADFAPIYQSLALETMAP
jgi:hypothetical protein